MIESVIYGVHTYSVGMILTYKQYKRVLNACYETECVIGTSHIFYGKERLYCYAYREQGLKVYLHGISGELYRLSVQIEPCRVLGDVVPTTLFKPDKWNYRQMVKSIDKLLKKLKVPCSVDNMKISRCDLTANVEFSSQEELMEYLRIFKKSLIIPHYKFVFFKKNDQKAKNWKRANTHSHCLSCKSASFLIYDKVAQLEMIDRCDETLLGKHILRLEAELKRPALKKHIGKITMYENQNILVAASQKCPKVISWYVNRLQPRCKHYLRYEDAVKQVRQVQLLKEKTRSRMLYLLRKTSDRDSLAAALEDLRTKENLSKSQCSNILKKFKRLGISPITLRNDSTFDTLPALIVEG